GAGAGEPRRQTRCRVGRQRLGKLKGEAVLAAAILATLRQVLAGTIARDLRDFMSVNEDRHIQRFVWPGIVGRPTLNQAVGDLVHMSVQHSITDYFLGVRGS